jgi:hypothetical protein
LRPPWACGPPIGHESGIYNAGLGRQTNTVPDKHEELPVVLAGQGEMSFKDGPSRCRSLNNYSPPAIRRSVTLVRRMYRKMDNS